jgi:serine protease Do
MKQSNYLAMSCFFVFTILCSGITAFSAAFFAARIGNSDNPAQTARDIITNGVEVVDEQSAIIDVATKSSPSVVSIVISQDVPIYENYRYDPFDDEYWDLSLPERKQIGTQEQQVGAGTGFIVSADGLIITNRHVVDTEDASYTVIFNDGTKHEASIVAIDTLLDIAFIDIEGDSYIPLPLGSSSELKVGQSVIAIGNALGEFSNSVSAGIVSGLSRDILAGGQDGEDTERLNDLIQTDASINLGNSGGPLLDIKGNVIGVNVAVADQGENIGFAIPIDVVRDLLERFQTEGNIDRPALGVRFIPIDSTFQEENNLSVDYGALISSGTGSNQPAIIEDSAADKAGIREDDIILEVDGEKVTVDMPLNNLIQKHRVGDEITLRILRGSNEIEVDVTLEKAVN